MRYEVLLTEGAERDLEELYDYIAGFDSPANADYVLDQLMKVVEGLATFPGRGAYPMELLTLGTREYRQAFFVARILINTKSDLRPLCARIHD